MACASHSSKHLFIQTMAARLAVTSSGAMGRYIDYTTGDLTRIMFIPVTSYTRSAGRLLRGQPSDHDLRRPRIDRVLVEDTVSGTAALTQFTVSGYLTS